MNTRGNEQVNLFRVLLNLLPAQSVPPAVAGGSMHVMRTEG
jgi:hypothetical protein